MAIIDKPSDYFNTKLYTGTGSSNAVTGVGFQPDWIWLKGRSVASDHKVFDAVRGGPNNLIQPNLTNAQQTTSYFSSINSDGFTVTGSDNSYNASNATYASWNWKANGSGSSNTAGSINSTVSANTTSGCSIVTVANVGSGNFTFGHGLGVAPSWVLAKSRDGGKWNNYFKSLGAGYTIQLPETGAKIVNNTMWQNTSPTSSVVYSHGGQLDANESYVFYCFAEKTGFSKFGSYVGNGNADGTFVYLGFKPAFLLYKNSTASATNWQIHDSKRSPSNLSVNRLNPNDTSVELGTTADSFDFLSNGFKARATASNSNTSGATFIYMAFAENPFVSSTGVPATAR